MYKYIIFILLILGLAGCNHSKEIYHSIWFKTKVNNNYVLCRTIRDWGGNTYGIECVNNIKDIPENK